MKLADQPVRYNTRHEDHWRAGQKIQLAGHGLLIHLLGVGSQAWYSTSKENK